VLEVKGLSARAIGSQALVPIAQPILDGERDKLGDRGVTKETVQ
jgi:hypothetical protein